VELILTYRIYQYYMLVNIGLYSSCYILLLVYIYVFIL